MAGGSGGSEEQQLSQLVVDSGRETPNSSEQSKNRSSLKLGSKKRKKFKHTQRHRTQDTGHRI